MPQTDPALFVRVSTEAGYVRIPAAIAALDPTLKVVDEKGREVGPTKPRVPKGAATPTPNPEATASGDDKE